MVFRAAFFSGRISLASRSWVHSFAVLLAVMLVFPFPAAADSRERPPRVAPVFDDFFNTDSRTPEDSFFGEVTEIANDEARAEPVQVTKAKSEAAKQVSTQPEKASDEAPNRLDKKKLYFVGDDYRDQVRSPDEDVPMRIERDAPVPFIKMVEAGRNDDNELAFGYARQFVRYMNNLMFEVRKYTRLIGKAMIAEGQIKEDDWMGVEQFIDWSFAKAREENNSIIKPRHKQALERIKADPDHKVSVYYFFSLNSSYSRYMAPDVERLWQVAKRDPRIKMVALTLDNQPKMFVDQYREYTGLTAPVKSGKGLAEQFSIAFVPALVVVTPSDNQAYLRTGQQSFTRMYEFVRTAQGLPIDKTPLVEKLINRPIGAVELQSALKKAPEITPSSTHRVAHRQSGNQAVRMPAPKAGRYKPARF